MTHRTGLGRDLSDLLALHGQQVAVEQVDLVEDVDGIPAWIDVERGVATVVIVPSLLGPVQVDTRPGCVDTSPELREAPVPPASENTAPGGSRQPTEGNTHV